MAGVEVTAGDWPLGGRFVRFSEDTLARVPPVGFLSYQWCETPRLSSMR